MGAVERHHRHVVDIGLALINHSGLPILFWRYAFSAAVFTYNRTTTVNSAGASAYELLYGLSPNIRDFKVFGCLAFPNTRPFNRVKFGNRSAPHTFIRYPTNMKGYLCFNPITKKVMVSRDFLFLEEDFSQNVSINGLSDSPEDKNNRLNIGSPKSNPLEIVQRRSTDFRRNKNND